MSRKMARLLPMALIALATLTALIGLVAPVAGQGIFGPERTHVQGSLGLGTALEAVYDAEGGKSSSAALSITAPVGVRFGRVVVRPGVSLFSVGSAQAGQDDCLVVQENPLVCAEKPPLINGWTPELVLGIYGAPFELRVGAHRFSGVRDGSGSGTHVSLDWLPPGGRRVDVLFSAFGAAFKRDDRPDATFVGVRVGVRLGLG